MKGQLLKYVYSEYCEEICLFPIKCRTYELLSQSEYVDIEKC